MLGVHTHRFESIRIYKALRLESNARCFDVGSVATPIGSQGTSTDSGYISHILRDSAARLLWNTTVSLNTESFILRSSVIYD
jgi:hypothetical protein